MPNIDTTKLLSRLESLIEELEEKAWDEKNAWAARAHNYAASKIRGAINDAGTLDKKPATIR